jgi:PAS domain S-box-containing protein
MGNVIINKGQFDKAPEKRGVDTAEIERLKKALAESQEKFNSVFRNNPLGLSITSLKDNAVLEINNSFTAFTGYTREEIIRRPVNEMKIWADPSEREKMLQTLAAKGRVSSQEYNLRDASGEIHPVLLSVEPIIFSGEECLLVMAQDITEYKRTRKALRESEEKFSKAFRCSPVVIVISRLADSLMVEVNDTFLHLTGYKLDEVIGKKATGLGIWANPEERAEMVRTLTSRGAVCEKEYLFRMKSGERRTWLFSAEIVNMSNEPCILSVATDITERKQAEEKLCRLDKNKSEFLSNVSHELRTPLQSISGFTQLIMNGQVPDAATRQEFLQIIDR